MHHLDDSEPRKPSGPHVIAQQAYYEARRRHEVAKRVASEAHDAKKRAEEKLVETMMDLGITRLDYMEDGSKIHFTGKSSISIREDNREDVRQWLRERYGDDRQFDDDQLDKKAVNDQIKADLQSNVLSETDVPRHMKLQQRPGISVSGWKEV